MIVPSATFLGIAIQQSFRRPRYRGTHDLGRQAGIMIGDLVHRAHTILCKTALHSHAQK